MTGSAAHVSASALSSLIPIRLGAGKWSAACVPQHDADQGHTGSEHLVLMYGLDIAGETPPREPTVRIHSECVLGDVFAADDCDCGTQLQAAIAAIEDAGEGVLIYLRQEGRGIGLFDKLRSLRQDGDTFQRNISIGRPADARGYVLAAEVLRQLGCRTVRLLSGNPAKIAALRAAGLGVTLDPSIAPESLHGRALAEIQAKVRNGYLYDVGGTTPASDHPS